MWVEAKMKCYEIRQHDETQPIFQPTGLLQYITTLQTHILAVQICTVIIWQKLQLCVSLMVGGNEPLV